MLNFQQHTQACFWKHYTKLRHILWLTRNMFQEVVEKYQTLQKREKKEARED